VKHEVAKMNMGVQKEISRFLSYAGYASQPALSRIWPARTTGYAR